MKTSKQIKLILAAGAIAVPMFSATLLAQTGVTWNPGATIPANWNTPGNWGGTVPVSGYKAFLNGASSTPAIVTDTEGGCQIALGDGGGPCFIVVSNGGFLQAGDSGFGTLDNNGWTTIGNTAAGTIDVEGGTVFFAYHMWVGSLNSTGNGTLLINGGVASVTNDPNANWQCGNNTGGLGHIQVNGGTLILGKWDPGRFATNNASSMDIAGGTVLVLGDHTANMTADINAGKVTIFGSPAAANFTLDYNNLNPGYTTLKATGGGGGGCAEIDGFNGTGLAGYFQGWTNATITPTSTSLQISATTFGDGYQVITPAISTTSSLTLALDVTLSGIGGGVVGPLVILQDGTGNQIQYAFYNQAAGEHILTAPLSSGTLVAGPGPFDFTTLSFFHVQLDPEGVSTGYTVAFNDLSITGCGGGGTAAVINSISLGAGNVNITAQTQSGATYHVEGAPSFPASWTTVSGTSTNTTGTQTVFSFPVPASSMQFFRVGSP